VARNHPAKSTQKIAEETAERTVEREIRAVFHRGPMPSPDVMAKYEELYPGAVEFFFHQLQQQSEHRQALERAVTEHNIRASNRGQWMAFILFFVVAAAGFTGIFLGRSVAGTITALAGLAGPLALFFNRRKRSDSALRRKEQE
jgi:uncharacterized membrane protein